MKTITINQNGLGRYDDVSPFLVEKGSLDLSFSLPRQSGDFYFAAELNGKSLGARLIPLDGKVSIKELESGDLTAKVHHYLRGTLIRTYKVEPLLLKRVEETLEGTPEIIALRAKDSYFEAKIAWLEERLHTAHERAEKAEEKLKTLGRAFLAFAFAEYEGDVQLNTKGLSFREFMKELGYGLGEFSEEEIAEIEAAKEIF